MKRLECSTKIGVVLSFALLGLKTDRPKDKVMKAKNENREVEMSERTVCERVKKRMRERLLGTGQQ